MDKIKWSEVALSDFWRLHEFLNNKDTEAAARMAQIIRHSSMHVSKNPEIGKPLADGSGRREYYIAFGGSFYALRYHLNQERLPVVLRVWHSREDRKPV